MQLSRRAFLRSCGLGAAAVAATVLQRRRAADGRVSTSLPPAPKKPGPGFPAFQTLAAAAGKHRPVA
jgi:hypothetical protein